MSTGNHKLNNNFIIVITLFQGGTNLLAIRAKGYTFRPQVFARGVYKIETGDPILKNGRC